MHVEGPRERPRRAGATRVVAVAALLIACAVPPQETAVVPAAPARPARELPSTDEVLRHVRAAVHHDALRALERGVRVRGSCSIEGLDGEYSLLFEPGGSFLQEVRTALPETTGFDGTTCWARDATGMPRVLALGGRTSTLARMGVLTLGWLDEDSAFSIGVDPEASDEDAVVLTLELGDGPWRATLRVDRATWLPRRLASERSAGERVFELDDWQPALGFLLPRHLTITGVAGDVSVFEVEHVDPAPTFVRNPYELVDARPDDTTFAEGEPAAIEVRRASSGHLLVHPTLGGQDVGWFLLDSGAGAMCVEPTVADRLGLERFGKVSVVGAGGAIPGAFRSGAPLGLGPLSVRGLQWLELSLAPLAPLFGVDELGGILGFDLFMRAVVVVDAAGGRVELYAPDHYELPEGAWHELRLDDRTPCVEAAFEGGHRGWFRLDIGSDDTVLFHGPTVERLGLLEGREVERVRIGGVGGFSESRRGPLAWIEVGGHRVEDLRVTFHDSTPSALRSPYTAGILGLGLLERFVIVLDYAGARVAFLERDA